MKRPFFILLILLTLVATNATATPAYKLPPGKWWENQRLIEHIKLTPEQQAAIGDLVYQHAEQMIDLNADVERSKLALDKEVDQQSFDPAKVRKAFLSFQNARQALELERFEMLLSVRQLLSAEQWKELLSLRERLEQMRQRRDRPGVSPNRGDRRPPGGGL